MIKKVMTRGEFLKSLGLSGAAIVTLSCLGGLESCSSNTSTVPAAPSNVNFTIDLTQSAYTSLNTNGNFVYANGIMIARTTSGDFIALAQACTHQGTSVQYQSSSDNIFCPNHGARFNKNGTVISGPAPSSLRQYSVSRSGNILTIRS